MNFTPLLPSNGILGFRLLEQTEDTQRAVFDRQPEIEREVQYFLDNIGSVETADDLVSDRRLRVVAVEAFGLDERVDGIAFLRKMLEEGTDDTGSLANRLSDPRFERFVDAFGFGNAGGSRIGEPGFANEIVSAFKERRFERAVGEQDNSLRLALNFRREIQRFANSESADSTAFIQVLGDQPVRKVLESVFGLGESFGQLDIDRQRDEFRDFTNRIFGSPSLAVFQDPAQVDKAITRYLARESALNGPSPTTPGFSALTLLNQGNPAFGNTAGVGSQAIQNILLSAGN